jgi:tetratricopeptide (TPR) repeat protein
MTNQSQSAPGKETLLKRANILLEDGEFDSATEYYNRILDIDPECAEAYLGLLMAEVKAIKTETLTNVDKPLNEFGNYKRALRFADEGLRKELEEYNLQNLADLKKTSYHEAKALKESAKTADDYKQAAEKLREIGDYRDSEDLIQECLKLEKEEKDAESHVTFAFDNPAEKERVYQNAVALMEKAKSYSDYNETLKEFLKFPTYRDSNMYAARCRRLINEYEQLNRSETINMYPSPQEMALDNPYNTVNLIINSIEILLILISAFYFNNLAKIAEIAEPMNEKWGDGFHQGVWLLYSFFAVGVFLHFIGEISKYAAYKKTGEAHNLKSLKRIRRKYVSYLFTLFGVLLAIAVMPNHLSDMLTDDNIYVLKVIAEEENYSLSTTPFSVIAVIFTIINVFGLLNTVVRISKEKYNSVSPVAVIFPICVIVVLAIFTMVVYSTTNGLNDFEYVKAKEESSSKSTTKTDGNSTKSTNKTDDKKSSGEIKLSGSYILLDDTDVVITFTSSGKVTYYDSYLDESSEGSYYIKNGKITITADGETETLSFSQSGNSIWIDGDQLMKK